MPTNAAPSASSLQSHAGYWLRLVSNHVSHAFKLKVESRDVTVAEWVVLRALFDVGEGAGVNPSRLAESLGLTRGAVSKLLDRLATKGHVTCRSVRQDRRFQMVSLTASGRRLVPALAEMADQNEDEFFGHLTAQEFDGLIRVLRDIVARRGLGGVPLD